MGRKVRRVPLDFDQPLNEVWPGFLMPDTLDEDKCETCDGDGYSAYARHQHDRWYGYVPFDPAETGSKRFAPDTPAVRAFAERNVRRSPDYYGRGEQAIVREAARLAGLWNGMWAHHLHQDDVDALIAGNRLWDFTRTWTPGTGWVEMDPAPAVTAERVNLWSLEGFGHDSINCGIVVRAACERAGQPETCADCDGHGSHEAYPGQRAEAEAWEATEPPQGDGWQLWETVSEGSPISPVFATADGLAEWLADPSRERDWMPLPAAQKFVAEGWAPSFVGGELGITPGAEWIGMRED